MGSVRLKGLAGLGRRVALDPGSVASVMAGEADSRVRQQVGGGGAPGVVGAGAGGPGRTRQRGPCEAPQWGD